MLKRLSLIGTMILTLSAGIVNGQPAAATDTATFANRPALSEFESALQQIEDLGDYLFYFGDTSLPLTADDTPYYSEYNYLLRVATNIKAVMLHYDDEAYFTERQFPPSIMQDILDEAHNAIRGCSLILGLNRTAKTEVSAPTPATPTPASTDAPVSTANNTPTTTPNPQPAQSATTSPKAVAQTPAPTSTEAVEPSTTETTTPTANDIKVPDTGVVEEKRQISWPALIAVTVTGAAAASIVIAIVIRHEPRRRPAARRRRR